MSERDPIEEDSPIALAAIAMCEMYNQKGLLSWKAAEACIRAWLDSIADTHKVVPVTPTPEMRTKLYDARGGRDFDPCIMWHRVLRIAPPPPGLEDSSHD